MERAGDSRFWSHLAALDIYAETMTLEIHSVLIREYSWYMIATASICLHVSLWVCICLYMSEFVCMHLFVFAYICVYVYLYEFMCLYMSSCVSMFL